MAVGIVAGVLFAMQIGILTKFWETFYCDHMSASVIQKGSFTSREKGWLHIMWNWWLNSLWNNKVCFLVKKMESYEHWNIFSRRKTSIHISVFYVYPRFFWGTIRTITVFIIIEHQCFDKEKDPYLLKEGPQPFIKQMDPYYSKTRFI